MNEGRLRHLIGQVKSGKVSRRQFLLGKYVGTLMAALMMTGVLAWCFVVVLYFKQWYDNEPLPTTPTNPVADPNNAAADSHWYHLPIAEHYVAEGAVRPFVEGWYQGALPHLASILYAWAFMRPWAGLFDHVELAAHLEFVLFLETLFCVAVLVRLMSAPAAAFLRRTRGGPRGGGPYSDVAGNRHRPDARRCASARRFAGCRTHHRPDHARYFII